MRIIFFGTPQFAATVLNKVQMSGHSVVAIVTKEDQRAGRSLHYTLSPVKQFALEHTIPCLQPPKLASVDTVEHLKSYQPDLFIVVAYGEILPQVVLDIPRYECINVHASLLPRYRGAAPIQHALMHGDVQTGVTIMKMVRRMDAGDIMQQGRIPILPDDTTGTLEVKLARLGGGLLCSTILQVQEGTVVYSPQKESDVTYAPKLSVADGELHWDASALSLVNRIRACDPKPGAWCWVNIDGQRKRLNVKQGSTFPLVPGISATLLSKKQLLVSAKDGVVHLSRIQLEGKKEMEDELFMRGIRHIEFLM